MDPKEQLILLTWKSIGQSQHWWRKAVSTQKHFLDMEID